MCVYRFVNLRRSFQTVEAVVVKISVRYWSYDTDNGRCVLICVLLVYPVESE